MAALAWLRRFLHDVRIHFFHGTLCVLARRHRAERYVGEIGKKGYRGVPIYQCGKCHTMYLHPTDAVRLGGKISA